MKSVYLRTMKGKIIDTIEISIPKSKLRVDHNARQILAEPWSLIKKIDIRQTLSIQIDDNFNEIPNRLRIISAEIPSAVTRTLILG